MDQQPRFQVVRGPTHVLQSLHHLVGLGPGVAHLRLKRVAGYDPPVTQSVRVDVSMTVWTGLSFTREYFLCRNESEKCKTF